MQKITEYYRKHKKTFVKYTMIGIYTTIVTTAILWFCREIMNWSLIIINPILTVIIYFWRYVTYDKFGLIKTEEEANKMNFEEYIETKLREGRKEDLEYFDKESGATLKGFSQIDLDKLNNSVEKQNLITKKLNKNVKILIFIVVFIFILAVLTIVYLKYTTFLTDFAKTLAKYIAEAIKP